MSGAPAGRAPGGGSGGELPVLEPADLGEARDAVRDTPGALRFAGAGTKASWGMPPERTDAVVSTRRLDALVDHSAGDMIAVVGAGLPLARLQEALAGAGQRLAVDPPRTERGATVGGIFAADDAGPRRHRYGTLRDLVLGVTVVLADGSIGRAGGRVVKNVAGYDLMRLLCGSLGTLGFVTELTVRLHPLPEASTTLRVPLDVPAVPPLATAVTEAVAPLLSALEWGRGALHVRLEGREPAVRVAAAAVERLAGDHGAAEAEVLTGSAEAAAWAALAGIAAGNPEAVADPAAAAATGAGEGAGEGAAEGAGAAAPATTARAAALPDRFPAVLSALDQAAAEAGVEVAVTSAVNLGLHTAAFGGQDARASAAAVAAWRRAVADLGGTVVVRDAAEAVTDHVDAWLDPAAPAPSALPLMRRVKHALDPGRRCAPGRFLGGL